MRARRYVCINPMYNRWRYCLSVAVITDPKTPARIMAAASTRQSGDHYIRPTITELLRVFGRQLIYFHLKVYLMKHNKVKGSVYATESKL